MANFDKSGMTQAGINLMGKAIGGATIQFTKLVLGDGTMTGEILDLQGVVSPKQNVDVTRIERADNQCTVGGELLTSSVKQGFFWRECGLYAMDPDVGEILYNYAYSTKPDYIASSDSGMMEEILVSMIATVGSNTNVDVTIDDSMVFASKKEVLKKPNYYRNVEMMLADSSLQDGDMAITLGYYSPGDGGNAKYHISKTNVNQGGIALNGNLFANIIIGDRVNVRQFGAKGDGATDDADCIQKACDYAQRNAPNKCYNIYFPPGDYILGKGIDITSNGYTGVVYGDTVGRYSTTISAKNSLSANSMEALISASVKLDAEGNRIDRFGRRLYASGPLEVSGLSFNAIAVTKYNDKCTLTSVSKACLDLSSSSYVKVSRCSFSWGECGLRVAKWHGVVEKCHFTNNNIGIQLAQRNITNTPSGVDASNIEYALATNNFIIQDNNFSTQISHIYSHSNELVKIVNNCFDLCFAPALYILNPHHAIVRDNYFEACCSDKKTILVRHKIASGWSETEETGVILVASTSNTLEGDSRIDIEDNQIVNNTSHINVPMLTYNHVKNLVFRRTSTRGYHNGGVHVFGQQGYYNEYAVYKQRHIIEMDLPKAPEHVAQPVVTFADGIGQHLPFTDLKVYSKHKNASFNVEESGFLVNDLSLFTGDGTSTIVKTIDDKNFSTQTFAINPGAVKILKKTFTFNSGDKKPNAITVELAAKNTSPDYGNSLVYEVLVDGISKGSSTLVSLKAGDTSPSIKLTTWLGFDYSSLEIRIKISQTSSIVLGKFCIYDSLIGPVFLQTRTFYPYKPSNPESGKPIACIDTTSGKMLFWDGLKWLDAMGTTI